MYLRQVAALEEIKKEIIRLRALPGTWRTNLFASDEVLSRWCEKGDLYVLADEESFFLLRRREAFFHAFFCTVSLPDAEKALFKLARKIETPVSIDIVGEDEELGTMPTRAGFHHAATLKRMTRPNEDMQAENLPLREGEYARLHELSFLAAYLKKTFDPMTKQLPDEDELSRMVREKRVLTLRTPKNCIAGFLVFEPQRARVLLRYMVVTENGAGSHWAKRYCKNPWESVVGYENIPFTTKNDTI